MDVNAITIRAINTTAAPRARLVSLELRQQFRADGLCVRCGLPGHWVKDCKLRPYINSTGKVTIAAINDDEYDCEEDELDSDDPDHPDAWQRNIFHT
jgi:RecB family exonuclease